MWVLIKIGYINDSGQIIYQPFMYLTEYFVENYNLVIHLRHTDTGDYEVLYAKDNPDFLSQLRKFNPYGYINNNSQSPENFLKDDLLIAVDDLTLQLMDYVESIKTVNVHPDDILYAFVSNLDGVYVGLDPMMTLYRYNRGIVCYCSLFHAMCYAPESWRGDSYYIPGMADFATVHPGVDVRYKVAYIATFNDAQAAKRLVAKALISGINPLKVSIAEQLRF